MKAIASLLLVKSGEGRQVAFFMLLLICLGAGMAIGRGSADVLFLKRYGIEYLPVMYLILSLVLAVCFTLYAAFVDRLSSERFFYFLLSIEALLLVGFWCLISFTNIESVYPVYYIFYELVSELILVHAALYISQSLDTMQSKRLTSLILAGYQMGMIIGGLFFAMMMPYLGVEHSMLVWSGLLLISIFMLFMWHKQHGVSPFYMPPAKTSGNQVKKAIKEVSRGLQFVRQSTLLKNASFALFFMVLMFYVLTYSINKIYVESFESEATLAMFFGILVAVTNLLAVILQVFVSARVIEKIGVRKAKLIYPVMTLVSYLLLLISPGFYMALFASVNNSAVMPAFRNPTRQMFFNVIPDYMQGRARATSVALVLPVALFVCGVLILYLQQLQNQSLIIYFGIFCALMYWLFCYRMGEVYSITLIENLKKKLYLPEKLSKAVFRGSNDSLYPVLLKGLASDDDKVCLSYAELLINAFPDESVLPIIQRIESAQTGISDRLIRLIGSKSSEFLLAELMNLAEKGDEHLQATIYDVVLEYGEKQYSSLIDTALSAQNSRIKVSGIKAAIRQGPGELYRVGMDAWNEMLQGGWQQQMNVIDMQSVMKYVSHSQKIELQEIYTKLFASLLEAEGDNRRTVIYRAMARWPDLQCDDLAALIKQDMQSIDPELRKAVASCLHVLSEAQGRNECIWKMLADGHAEIRHITLQILEDLYEEPKIIYYEWLMQDIEVAPRAQKILLQALISHGVEREYLKLIIEKKSQYATQLLRAVSLLEGSTDVNVTLTKIVLEERLAEMIDMILLAIEPMTETTSIAVIRAGLSSSDAASVALAHEALHGLEDKKLAVVLSDMIDRKYDSDKNQDDSKEFSNVRQTLQWCVDVGDEWLQECSYKALTDFDGKVYA